MSVRKQYLKKNGKCKVTLTIPRESAGKAEEASVLGDFNQWDPKVHKMNHLKNGSFKAILELDPGRNYQFRYLLDGGLWINEPESDEDVPNFHGSRNSVLHL